MIAEVQASDGVQPGRVAIPLARPLSNNPVFYVKQHLMQMAAWVEADIGTNK
ncbi:hypothetical protein [Burkholderia lata]|jgi:hypothetical protein|uniref:hypothetical protein n=1 Tax=Burkholderia lata (strain ATCC 17760 / DSM 23089 / LMG 22485 / NCIMB 9086 / R18194 / 383) TaxID=482957 RepID=UPI0015821271|nr:hypothetical protein [Burkholderia lata]